MDKKVIVISGATATGKTSLSIGVAKRLIEQNQKCIIVNFDSLLFYRELNIGTAKPDLAERAGITHQMIDIASAKDPLNASEFVRLATPIVEKYLQNGEVVILVGGSAFYVRALIKGMYESETPDQSVQAKVQSMIDSSGNQGLIDFLKEHDPESLDLYHQNDQYRLSRAVTHYLQTGTKISNERKRMDDLNPYDLSINQHPDWSIHHFYLDIDKAEHLKLIEKRSRLMIKLGLLDEVKRLLNLGFTGLEKPLQSIGYKESIAHLRGDIPGTEELVEQICISTRQLAKAQKTFFKKIIPKQTLNALDQQSELIKIILEQIQ